MTTPIAVRRRRLRFRCWHRGTKESDILMGRFADEFVDSMDEEALDWLEALLEEVDPDIWDWVTGREPVPNRLDGVFMRRLLTVSNRLNDS